MAEAADLHSQHLAQLTPSGFSALIGAAVDGIVIIDHEGKILSFNSAAEKMFGYRFDEVSGNNISMLMPPPYREEHDGYMQEYSRSKIPKIIGIGRKVEALRKDGSIFPIHLAVGEYVESGQLYYVGTIRDLTEQDKVERESIEIRQRLAHMDRVNIMGEMASGIAHELNQPLAAISSYVQACRRRIDAGEFDQEKLRELVVKTDEQAQRAGAIIRRIRALVRTHDFLRENIDVNKVIMEIVEFARADAKRRGVDLATNLSHSSCNVAVDSVQIQQVLLNLVLNAVDVTVESQCTNAKVLIASEILDGKNSIKISVRDFGAGIPDEIQSRLFEAFVSTKEKGTGMGLSISRSIVVSHGGEIWEKSMKPGTEFCFTLPGAKGIEDKS